MRTGKPELSILIPVTANEAVCLPATLESVRLDITKLNQPGEIIVIANHCAGTSDVIAEKIFEDDKFNNSLINHKVVHCETPGKMFAVNDGIEEAKGKRLVLIDGDLILDPGSFAWTIDALNRPGVKVVSMHHAPIEGTLPKDEMLATVIVMNAVRRHTFPEKYWLHGAYLGWDSNLFVDGKPMRFPAGARVHEDNWLTSVLARDYDFKEAIRVTKNYMARFIPPQNWDDYYRQQWRYQFAHEDLAKAFPSLAEYIPMIRKWTNEKYPESLIDEMWRETCMKMGIDFDNVVGFYKEVLLRVRQGRQESQILLGETGVWVQQITTKQNPIIQ